MTEQRGVGSGGKLSGEGGGGTQREEEAAAAAPLCRVETPRDKSKE